MRLLACLLILALATACRSAPRDAPRLKPSSTSTSTEQWTDASSGAPTPEEIVTDPGAELAALTVSPADPAVRLAVWTVCANASCGRRHHAVVVTDDGFETRHVLDLPVGRWLQAARSVDADTFLLPRVYRTGVLIDADGEIRRVARPVGPAGPLADGEAVAPFFLGNRHVAVDPVTGRTHPLSLPENTATLTTAPGGQLRAVVYAPGSFAYFFSDDGGTSWHGGGVPGVLPGRELVGAVPVADPGLHVLSVSPDGATVSFWDRTLRSSDGLTWTTYDGPDDPRAVADRVAVLPDGRLIVNVTGWSDDRLGKPSRHPTGLSASAGWTAYTASSRQNRGLRVLDVVVSEGRVTVWAAGWGERTNWLRRTEDGGLTWRVERAR